MKSKAPLISLEQAQLLVMHLEQGEQAAADELLTAICCAPNSGELLEKIGHLTRQLHTSLKEFQLDPRLPDLVMQEMPDSRERLNYVITMTDKAANRTMDAVDAGLPLASQLSQSVQQLLPAWNGLMTRHLDVGQFKILCHQLDAFIKQTDTDASQLRDLLTEILMAQDFQDLTGQMIRRVITLSQEVESKLVEMLMLFGEPLAEKSESSVDTNRGIEAEGPIINKETRTDVVNSQDDVDDLLSSLGF